MKKIEKKNIINIIIIAVFLITALLASIGVYYSFLQKQLFNERKSLFTSFTEKVVENVDSEFENFWEQVEICELKLAYDNPSSIDLLLKSFQSSESVDYSHESIVIAFDELGNYYSSEGNSGAFNSLTDLDFSNQIERQISVVNLPYKNEEDTHYLFFKKLDKNIMVDEAIITHISIAVDTEAMIEICTPNGFSDSCYIFLLNDEGKKIFKNTYSESFIDGYNVIEAIKNNSKAINGGTINDFKSSFERKETNAIEIEYMNENWFLSSVYLDATNHHLILFVPTEMLSTSAVNLLGGSILFSVVIILIFLVLFGSIIAYINLAARKDREMLSNQKRTNEILAKEREIAEFANKAKSEFLSYMSHDIRTPINGIMGMTSIAMKNIEDEEKVSNCLRKIDSSSRHLLSLINDVLDMSRIESGKTILYKKPLNINLVIDNCAEIVDSQISNRELTFITDFKNVNHPFVMGDELHLRQILINILGNAIKFTPDGGTIVFRVFDETVNEDTAKLIFEIEDDGIGMSEEYLAHIWEKFTQENDGSRANYEGSGLGMAITKSLVDLFGGIITVESELDKGSKFRVEIDFEIDKNINEQINFTMDNIALNDMNVLLVEDNEINQEIAIEILSEAGANVICVDNGKKALDKFLESNSGDIDVILMDVMMPVMNGIDATKAIRSSEHPDANSIPIIGLTANAFEEDIKKTIKAGMNIHLSKPLNFEKLLRTLLKYKKTSYDFTDKNVLIADDDENNIFILKELLESKGAIINSVSNGRDVLLEYEKSEPFFYDFILIDVRMPFIDGIEVTKRIRSLNRIDSLDVKIIGMSANVYSEDIEKSQESGMTAHLIKPIDIKVIEKILSNDLEKNGD